MPVISNVVGSSPVLCSVTSCADGSGLSTITTPRSTISDDIPSGGGDVPT